VTRSALVTGASRGIGAGIATELARRGYDLTVTARDAARLADVRAALLDAGAPRVAAVAGDLADEAHLEAAAGLHAEAYGTMDVLVLNAGVGTAGPVADYRMSRFDKTFAVNVRAPFRLTQLALPLLRAAAAADPARGARVIALSSVTGVHAEPGLAAYGASKAALLSLVDTLNAEESGHGVTATALAPGFVDTDMAAWVTDRVPAATMIPVSDVVALVAALVDLSARSVVGRLTLTRAGTTGHEA
jgi:3-oxoacyl-[acyl-carrier protein] reductase